MNAPRRLLLALLLFNIAPAAWAEHPVLDYFTDRGKDLADVLRLRVLIPEEPTSMGVKARATALVQAGAVHFDGTTVGIDRREIGVVREERDEIGASLLYHSANYEIVRDDAEPPTVSNEQVDEDSVRVQKHAGWGDGRDRPFSVGVEAQPPMLPGLDIGVYPSEAVDFVLGFIGIDMFGDDREPAPPELDWPESSVEEAPLSVEPFVFEQSFDEELDPFLYPSAPADAAAETNP